MTLPLQDIRITDLSWALAGPYATMQLADLGAEVIKVEGLQNYDQARGPLARRDWRPYPADAPNGQPFNLSSLFNKPNRNKLGLTLDLTRPEGREAVLGLVKISDVLIENYSVRVMKKFGLSYEDLRAVQPDIIMVSMPAFGLTGSEKDYIAYGSSLEMISGHTGLRGYGDGIPVRSALNYGDPIGGLNAAGAILAALHHRDLTGQGQHVEVAQLEALTSLLGEYFLDYTFNDRLSEPMGNRHPSMAPHGSYQCQGDDKWIAIACGSDAEWRALCGCMGRPELADDPRFRTVLGRKQHEDALDDEVAAWAAGQDVRAAFETLTAAGIAAGPALNNQELFEDPQLAERGFFVPISHAEAGTHLYPGTPVQLSRTPGGVRFGAPTLGQHNRVVLQSLLGYSDGTLDAMTEAEIIGTVPTVDVWAQR